ncbi:MAG: hypothetical protein JKY01_03300 [Pseudomonadales bacterium]|nr:hypothetical protein [Pseudomonadales bacterium]
MTIKTRIYTVLAVLVLSISTYILTAIYSLAGDTQIRLGSYDFFIPAEYGPEGFMNLSVRWFTSQFQSDEVAIFSISEEELSANISGYEVGQGRVSRNIKGLIRVWNDTQIKELQNPQRYSNLWRGTGRYQNRQVMQKGEYYQVFRTPKSPKVWTVLKLNPAEKIPLPDHSFDFWVARCVLQSKPFQRSETFTVCNSYSFVDNVVVEFYLAEENLRFMDEIRGLIEQKIKRWRS